MVLTKIVSAGRSPERVTQKLSGPAFSFPDAGLGEMEYVVAAFTANVNTNEAKTTKAI